MKLVSLQKVYDDTAILFFQIYNSGFKPDVIASVYKGGCSIIAPTLIELFIATGHSNFYHAPFKASSYQRPRERKEVKFEGLGALKERLRLEDKVLIVEDIVDEGKTFERIMQELQLVVKDVRFAVLYWRKDKNSRNLIPNYYVETVNQWINFPHEISDLARENIELIRKRDGIWQLIAEIIERNYKSSSNTSAITTNTK